MANPTTNFGWVMPTNTDLVTDLPADFAVFGQGVDTSLADLNGGTTGQVLSKTSNTNLDFTWVSANPGDITGVTAGTGISGGGTSGDVTVTNSMATAFTTSGDLIQATGSGTFARLATGTSGQYLTTNGTTNSWATPASGGMTLLSTTTLSGASTTISSISQSYTNLEVVIANCNIATGGALKFQCNGSASQILIGGDGYDNGTVNANTSTFALTRSSITAGNTSNAFNVTVSNYASTTTSKPISSYGYATYSGQTYSNFMSGAYTPTTAVTSLVIGLTAGTFSAGTVYLYGVK